MQDASSDTSLSEFHQLLSQVYTPLITTSVEAASVSQRSAGDCISSMQKFSTQLSQFLNQGSGARLELPDLVISDPRVAADDLELVHLVARCVGSWSSVISQALQSLNTQAASPEPIAELEHWRYRAAALSALYEQAHSQAGRVCTQVLEHAGHPILPQLLHQLSELFRAYTEARDNALFLGTAERHLQTLSAGNVAATRAALRPLLAALRMVWVTSRHFNSEDRMAPLLQRISWRLCQTVRSRVTLARIFAPSPTDEESPSAILSSATGLLELWSSAYEETRLQVEHGGGARWDFDRRQLFSESDRICARLAELAEAHRVVSAISAAVAAGGDVTPELLTLRSRVATLVTSLQHAPDPFAAESASAWNSTLKAAHEDAVRINNHIAQMVETSFGHVKNVGAALTRILESEELAAVTAGSSRAGSRSTSGAGSASGSGEGAAPDTQQSLAKKVTAVLTQFAAEVDAVLTTFELNKGNPPIAKGMTRVAGSIMWCRAMFVPIKSSFKLMRQLPPALTATEVAGHVRQRFAQLAQSMQCYEREIFEQWTHDAPSILANLRRPLLTITDAHTGQLVVAPEDCVGRRKAAKTVRARWPIAGPTATAIDIAASMAETGLDPHLGAGDEALGRVVVNADFYNRYSIANNYPAELVTIVAEARSLDAAGLPVPETALVTVLQSDKCDRAREEIAGVLSTLQQTMNAAVDRARPLLVPALAAALGAIAPGAVSVCWTALGLDDYVNAAKRAATQFSQIAAQITKAHASLVASVDSLARVRLVPDPNAPCTQDQLSVSILGESDDSAIANGNIPAHFLAAMARQRQAEVLRQADRAGVTPALRGQFLLAAQTRKVPDLATFRDRLIAYVEKHIASAVEIGNSTCPLLCKIEETVTGRCTAACPLMAEFYSYWESRVLHAVTTMVTESLGRLLMLLNIRPAEQGALPTRGNVPLISITALLSSPDILTAPALPEIQKTLTAVLDLIVRASGPFVRWEPGSCRPVDAPSADVGMGRTLSPTARSASPSRFTRTLSPAFARTAAPSVPGEAPVISPASMYHTVCRAPAVERYRADISRAVQTTFTDVLRSFERWTALFADFWSVNRPRTIERFVAGFMDNDANDAPEPASDGSTFVTVIEPPPPGFISACITEIRRCMGAAEAVRQALEYSDRANETCFAPADCVIPPVIQQIDFIILNCRQLASSIRHEALEWARAYCKVLFDATAPILVACRAELTKIRKDLLVQPATVAELKHTLALLEYASSSNDDRDRRFRLVTDIYETLASVGYCQFPLDHTSLTVEEAAEFGLPALATTPAPPAGPMPRPTDLRLLGEFSRLPQEAYTEGVMTPATTPTTLMLSLSCASMPMHTPIMMTYEALTTARALHSQLDELKTVVKDTSARLVAVRAGFYAVTEAEAADVQSAIASFASAVASTSPDDIPVDGSATDDDFKRCSMLLGTYLQKIQDLQHKVTDIQASQRLFGLPSIPWTGLQEIDQLLHNLSAIFRIHAAVTDDLSSWMGLAFHTVDVDSLSTSVQRLATRCDALPPVVRDLNAWTAVRHRLTAFQASLPLVGLLRSEALRHRHWQQLEQLAGNDTQLDRTVTLGALLDVGLHRFTDEIEAIVVTATKELTIERSLNAIQEQWRGATLDLVPHTRPAGDTVTILASTENITSVLDDSLMQLQSMQSSHQARPFASELRDWAVRLGRTAEVLEAWVEAQAAWLYLESVFAGPDIARQLPDEAERFSKADKSMANLGADARKAASAIDACHAAGLLSQLQGLIALMVKCQKGLADYLQEKRGAFPRLYFISDDELLAVLGTQDPLAIQPHVPKMFENTKSFVFKETAGAGVPVISVTALRSPEGEELTLTRPVQCTGSPEQWLTRVVAAMHEAGRAAMRQGVRSYTDTPRLQWLSDTLGMVGLSASQMWWGWGIERAFQRLAGGEKGAMKEMDAQMNAQINQLVQQIRKTDISKLVRTKLNTQIIIDVHCRDIIGRLIRDAVVSADEFAWNSTLRFYWEDDLTVKQCRGVFKFAYEYLGCSARLVITPLTDRCYVTLTTALSLYLGGNPAGPAGTGKTETVKDLSKALGRMCAVYNCGEGLDHHAMGRAFAGLAESGSTGCLDEVNRLEPEVLSVVSAQVHQIQRALQAHATSLQFEGRTIGLNSNCGIFITMNPGYAGRSELPDNLKALFRPVVMVVPDLQMIAEITLFSEGFQSAPLLAVKIIMLYDLAKRQLSPASHYDWSLRAIKTVLRTAGQLKRTIGATLPENDVLMAALAAANMPKFIAEDLALFNGLLHDLFPGVKIPTPQLTPFHGAVHRALEARGLQQDPAIIEKTVQLRDCLSLRWATMVVGGTGGGKSTIIKTLVDAATELGVKTTMHVIEPKAQSLKDFYGVLDPTTRAWTDGIFSKLFRDLNRPPRRVVGEDMNVLQTASDNLGIGTQGHLRILCLDGDVDALWIENLNSVMDDSQLLTLANSERISLAPTTKLVFEVPDLRHASPATVSRSAMVWVPPDALSPTSLWKTFVERLPALTTAFTMTPQTSRGTARDKQPSRGKFAAEIWSGCYDRIVLPLLRLVFEGVGAAGRSDVPIEMVIPTTRTTAVRRLIDILTAIITEPERMVGDDQQSSETQVESISGTPANKAEDIAIQLQLPAVLEAVFIFAVVNSIGAPIAPASTTAFDTALKELSGIPVQRTTDMVCGSSQLPACNLNDAVFDVLSGEWIPYGRNLPPLDAANTPFAELLVPTADTRRISTLLRLGLGASLPVLVTGPSGSSKTATIGSVVSHAPAGRYLSRVLSMSTRTSPNDIYATLDDNLEKHLRGTFAPANNRELIMVCDDIHMPTHDTYGTQATSSFLRQTLTRGGFYSKADAQAPLAWRQLRNVNFVATMGKPGGADKPVDPRLISQFMLVQTFEPSEESMRGIYTSLLRHHLRTADFPLPQFEPVVTPIVSATLSVAAAAVRAFPLSPQRCLCLFSMRDVSRVFQGLFAFDPEVTSTPEVLVRGWHHEMMRVYTDRLTSNADVAVVSQAIVDAVRREPAFADMSDFVLHAPIVFSDVATAPAEIATRISKDSANDAPAPEDTALNLDDDLNMAPDATQSSAFDAASLTVPARRYEDLGSVTSTTVSHIMSDIIDLHNSHMPKIEFSAFESAVDHILRVHRVLRQQRGHVLLVGDGGVGKTTIARMAAFAAGTDLATIRLKRGYGVADMRDDFRTFFRKVVNRPVTVLFTESLLGDSDGRDDIFLEFISGIVAGGLPPGLFTSEDRAGVVDDMRTIAQNSDSETDKALLSLDDTQIWNEFLRRCRDHLHIVMAFVPGNALRLRLRNFPVLLSCSYVNWVAPWSTAALESVASAVLTPVADGDDVLPGSLVAPLVSFASTVHTSAVEKAIQTSLRTGTTILAPSPRYYTEFLELCVSRIRSRRAAVAAEVTRFSTGVERLEQAAAEVADMRVQLDQQKIELDTKAAACDELLDRITKRTADAEAMTATAEAQEAQIQRDRAEILGDKAEAEDMLAAALPALESAAAALEALSKDDITVIRSYAMPPEPVQLVCECVVLLRQLPDVSWKGAKTMMSGGGFLRALIELDKDNIPARVVTNVETNYLKKHAAVLNQATMSQISAAGAGLLAWVEAIVHYSHTFRGVLPKKKRVQESEAKLEKANRDLERTKITLRDLRTELASLGRDLERATAEQFTLRERAETMARRLDAAARLVDGLGGESVRWSSEATRLTQSLAAQIGDAVLTAAASSYLGPFDHVARIELTHEWLAGVKAANIPCSDEFVPVDAMATPVEKLAWRTEGLPADENSVMSCILALTCPRPAYCADPQDQATSWLRVHEQANKVVVVQPNAPDLLRQLELCIAYGRTLIIENVKGTEIDPLLQPVILRQVTVGQGGRRYVMLGDKEVDWDDKFRLYLTCREQVPRLPSDLASALNVVSFAVTPSGLEGQLLDIVVAHERADLAARRTQLIEDMCAGETRLTGYEELLLRELGASTGLIVDNTDLITTLEDTRTKAAELKEQLASMKRTVEELVAAQEAYRPAAVRGATLFLTMNSMRAVSPMAHYALQSFTGVFQRSLAEAAPDTRPDVRVSRIVQTLTRNAVSYTTLGLDHNAKLTFVLSLALAIMDRELGILPPAWIQASISGAQSLETPGYPFPLDALPADKCKNVSWLTPRVWADIVLLARTIPVFSKLPNLISTDLDAWTSWAMSEPALTTPVPDPGIQAAITPTETTSISLAAFYHYALIRAIRVGESTAAALILVKAVLGATTAAAATSVVDYEDVYRLSAPDVPVLLISTPGADPVASLMIVAGAHGVAEKVRMVSLGQGQEANAVAALQHGIRQGTWVVLQNCHLLSRWLPVLVTTLVSAGTPHAEFRLWLTSAPTNAFPLPLLQSSIKVVTSAPSGLRLGVLAGLQGLIADGTIGLSEHPAYPSLVYVMCYLHTLLRERGQYGKLGWNVHYDFGAPDLRAACQLVAENINAGYLSFADTAALDAGDDAALEDLLATIPWDTLCYLVGDVIYGGRVIDDLDRRVLTTYLREYLGEFIFDAWKQFHLYTDPTSDTTPDQWIVPGHTDELVIAANNLPLDTQAEFLGLHHNAATAHGAEAGTLLANSAARARYAASTAVSSASSIDRLVNDTLALIPDTLPLEPVRRLRFAAFSSPSPLDVVLCHEIARLNTLLETVQSQLLQLQRALNGEIAFSSELDRLQRDIEVGDINTAWRAKAPQTTHRLAEWLVDLRRRRDQLRSWIDDYAPGELPPSIWLAGLHSPEALLSALVQDSCRRHGWALDASELTVTVAPAALHNTTERPADGLLLTGIYIEGVGWDTSANKLCDQPPQQVSAPMPPLLASVAIKRAAVKVGTFRTPVYITPQRRNAMGQGLVFEADLDSDVFESHWILQGAALTLTN